jgi:hypothetical protein
MPWVTWFAGRRAARRRVYHYFAQELADAEGQTYYRSEARHHDFGLPRRQWHDPLGIATRATGKAFFGAIGNLPFLSTPGNRVRDGAASAAGLARAASMAFLDYLKEIPCFRARRSCLGLEQLGLRRPVPRSSP